LRVNAMRDLSDREIGRLAELLDELARQAQRRGSDGHSHGDIGGGSDSDGGAPLDISAIDGLLCGALLQPEPVAPADWLRAVFDPEASGAAAPAARGGASRALLEATALVQQRHAVLAEAIAARRWFDPWLFELDDEAAGARASAKPWVAGFALATERFPGLMRLEAAALAQPLALLYQYFEPEDLEGLEDEPALAAALEDLEPPGDLTEVADDLVRAVLLLADVSRPRPQPKPPPARTAPAHASPGHGPRSRSGRRARARRGRSSGRCAPPAARARSSRR
jgi:uncharacterized protein